MFEYLGNKINKTIKKFKGYNKLTEINIASTIKEIKKTLINSDVNYNVAKDITDKIKKKAIENNIIESVSPGKMLTKIINDELTKSMGNEKSEIKLNKKTSIILILGLQGSGKTTFSGKLALHFKKKKKNVLLTTCDIYRPAAIEQIKSISKKIEVESYLELKNNNVFSIAENAIAYAEKNKKDILIIDTAGRLSIDEKMMHEIIKLKSITKPCETLFVVDSMIGQDAVNVAKIFNEKVQFDGIILTKIDGDTKGGAALSIKSITNKPIKFISQGEKMETLDLFYPDRMAKRILGMGDALSLVEKIETVYDEKEEEKIKKKIHKNQFNFNDLLTQIEQIEKLGNIKDISKMLPKSKNLNIDENVFKSFKIIIQSMTKREKNNPKIINGVKKIRIAKGSGTSIQEVNNLIQKFNSIKIIMKKLKNSKNKKKLLNDLIS